MSTLELRPLSTGELLDRTFTLYRSHFWLFIGIFALPQLILLGLQLLLASFPLLLQDPGPSTAISAVAVGMVGVLFGIGSLVVLGLTQAATVFALSEVYLGRHTTVSETYRRVRGKIWLVIRILILVGMAAVGGFILLVIPGIWVLLRTAISVPAGVLENLRARPAIQRSITLTKGHASRVFLILLLFMLISYAAIFLFQLPFVIGQASLAQKGQQSYWLQIFSTVSASLSSILIGPLLTIAYSLLYFDVRIRKEAFDLQFLMQQLDQQPSPPPSPSQPA